MTGPENQSSSPRLGLTWPWLLVSLAILFVVFVRARLLSMPLERDEGEYAYAGQLMLQGIPPYDLAYNMKLPGTYAAYAAIMAVFGQTTNGIHLGLIVVNVACMLLMFLLGRRLFDPTAGAVAAACYGVVSLSPSLLGLAAHATHFVVLPMLGGMLCLLRATDKGRRASFFAAGVLFGLAFVMKQQGVFFGIFGGSLLLWNGFKSRPVDWRRLAGQTGWYCLGCVLPFAMVCLALWRAGVFGNFWFWTFTYAHRYLGMVTWAEGVNVLGSELLQLAVPHWPLMLLALTGGCLLWWGRPARGRDWLPAVFLGFSALSVTPGLYFREHYFLLLLPAFSLFVGIAISFMARWRDPATGAAKLPCWLPGVLAAVALLFPACQQGRLFFVAAPQDAARAIYGRNPFLESREIAAYIREHSPTDARIIVFGSEPEIYFYSGRHSASGYIYMYDLMENQPYALEMHQGMIREVEAARPEYLVLVKNPLSGQPGKDSPRLILEWGAQYCRTSYDLVGAVDMISPLATRYVWGEAARTYRFQSDNQIFIFHRKPAA